MAYSQRPDAMGGVRLRYMFHVKPLHVVLADGHVEQLLTPVPRAVAPDRIRHS